MSIGSLLLLYSKYGNKLTLIAQQKYRVSLTRALVNLDQDFVQRKYLFP